MLKPKKSIEKMQAYEVPLFEKEWNLKIDSNENLYGPSEKVLDAIRKVEPKDVLFYPFYGEISQKIAEYTNFSIENIKVTNGADEAILAIFQTYLEKGDAVLTVTPSFAMPVVYSQVVDADLIEVPYKKKWEFPIDDFLIEIKKENVRLVHLTTPNNPTGECISKENMEKIISFSKDKVVLIDETYGNYTNSSYKEYARKYDNVFVVKSFSKDFGLAGLRLGYVISDEKNIKYLKSVVSPFSVNSIAAKAGVAALEDIEYFDFVKSQIEKSKEILKEGFEKIGMTVYPSCANFLSIDCGEKTDFIFQKLKSKNVIVKKFSSGGLLEGILRVTAPKPEDALELICELEIKDTIVFDMDGVLIDAGKSYRLAIQKTYEYFAKKEVSLREVQDAKNLGGLNNDWDLTEYLLKSSGVIVPKEEIIAKFQDYYWAGGNGFVNNEDLLIDKELLKTLSESFNLSIFTGRPKIEAIFALEKNGILDYFYPVITMDDIPFDKQKPHVCGIEKVKSLILAKDIIYIGDTKDDMICARNSSVKGIGVLPPQDKTDSLRKSLFDNGACQVIENVNELEKVLETYYEKQF